jgi:hypothetical protein
MNEGFKLYGVCLERLKHQINTARSRADGSERVVLESYCTGDADEIIDILEIYDIADSSTAAVMEKLKELAGDVSLMVRELVEFDLSPEGHLCLYWRPR